MPDPVVWSLGRVPGTAISLSAQIRDGECFAELARTGLKLFVDVAGEAPYVWRPGENTIQKAGVRYLRIDRVEDTNVDLPDFAFEAAAEMLEEARDGLPTLFFCAAGLKRSPHLLYGVLRVWGYDPGTCLGGGGGRSSPRVRSPTPGSRISPRPSAGSRPGTGTATESRKETASGPARKEPAPSPRPA